MPAACPHGIGRRPAGTFTGRRPGPRPAPAHAWYTRKVPTRHPTKPRPSRLRQDAHNPRGSSRAGALSALTPTDRRPSPHRPRGCPRCPKPGHSGHYDIRQKSKQQATRHGAAARSLMARFAPLGPDPAIELHADTGKPDERPRLYTRSHPSDHLNATAPG